MSDLASLTVVREWHPALVTLPGQTGTIGPAKVYLTEDPEGRVEVHVYTVAEGTVGLLTRLSVTARSLAGPYAPRSEPSTLTTPDGDLIVLRASGCGCGSPLKSLRAFSRYGPVAR